MLGVMIGLGVFLLVALVGAGIWAAKKRDAPAGEAAVVVEAPVAAPTPSPEPSESPAAEPAKVEKIQIRAVDPKDGLRLAIDGKALAPGVLGIDRPEPGKVRLLSVQADGYENDVYRIDDATPDVLDVILMKKMDEPTAKAPEGPTAPTPAAAPAKPADKKKPVLKPDIPDNPF